MKIYPIISLSADSNTYILEDEESKKCCIIDPGYSAKHLKRIISVIEKNLSEVPNCDFFIINTHCHYDHIGNDEYFADTSNIPCAIKIFLHEKDGKAILEHDDEKILSYLFGMNAPKISRIEFVNDEGVINLGKATLKILHTPGHTSGSISIYEEKTKSLFSGDLVFSNGIGRTDLKANEGNFEVEMDSIDKILDLKFNLLYPGHGKIGNYEDVKRIKRTISTL